MPKVSVIILTKNRAELLRQALLSVERQSFNNWEIIIVNDGSSDETQKIISNFKLQISNHLQVITHITSQGITVSRQEALMASQGEFVAILDDDDAWIDTNKLKKQVEFLDQNQGYVMCGGGIEVDLGIKNYELRIRPQTDNKIRNSMLLRNNFFTSTVMFRKEAAIKAGGFIKDQIDLGEDYDLWLRLGRLGKMYNFKAVFTRYTQPQYSKEKFKLFLQKQLKLIKQHKKNYPFFGLSFLIIKFRIK